ncbi:MAG: MFS transporter, partial [Mycoplasma sp.]
LLDGDKSVNEMTWHKSIRWFILTLLLFINILLLVNVGIFSAASSQIKTSLKLNPTSFGLFGSLNATGKIAGTLLFMAIINKWNRKYIWIISWYLNAFSIFSFTITTNLIWLYIARTINGICQVFGLIYIPIWIDQFGIQKQKTMMWTLNQLAAPIGMVSGYCLNNALGSKKWRLGYNIEAIGETIFLTIWLLFPSKYFSKKLFFKCHYEDWEKLENSKTRTSIFHEPQLVETNPGTNTASSTTNQHSVIKNWIDIFKNKIFLWTVLYKSVSQFILNGLGFWLTDYLENGWEVKNSGTKWYCYIIVIVVGPMIGMAFGGFGGSLIGGYDKKESVLMIF